MKKQFQSKSVPRGTRTIWRYLGALFILFTFAIGNVWAADTELCSATLNGITTGTNTDGIAQTGCTMKWSGVDASSNIVTVNDVKYYKLNGSSSQYVQLILSDGSFQAGDILTVQLTSNQSSAKSVAFKLFKSGNKPEDISVKNTEVKSLSYTLVAADIEDDGSIKITRGGSADSNARYGNFSVVRPEECTETAPTSVAVSGGATYDKGDALSNLSAAVTGGTGTMSYQWYRNTTNAATVSNDLKLANCTTATLAPINKVGTYYYYCVASNCAGSVTSGTTAVTINADCSATGDIFTITMNSSNAPSSEVKTPASSTMSIDTYINIDGGDIVLVTGSSQHSSITTSPKIKLGGSSGYAKITLDCPLQEGDKITFVKTNKIALAADASGTNKIQLASATNEYTITKEDCLYNQSNLFILRDGNNVEISSITITRPATYTVTFDNNGHGGTAPAAQSGITSGGKATEPTDPVDDNYNFGGWYNKANWQADGAEKWNFSTSTVTRDTTLYAKWTDKSVKSSDATLNAFSIDGYSFTETFAATTLDYTVNLPFYASIPATSAVHATKNDTKATLGDVTYDSTNKKYSVTVTAEDNTTTKTYTITLNIASTPTASSSINIEQLVLDNSTGYNIGAALDAAHIGYANKDALDSLKSVSEKADRNEPYLGLKFKKNTSSVTIIVPDGQYLKVKFGYVDGNAGLKVSVNGATAVAPSLTDGIYTLPASVGIKQVVFTQPGTDKKTVVYKQIKINEEISDVILPWKVTYDAGEHGTCATTSQIWKGTALTLPAVTPASGWDFEGWYDGETKITTSTYTPTADVTLVAHYTAQAAGTDLETLTYQIGAGAATNVGYTAGYYTYNIELPYKPSYDAITVNVTPVTGASVKDDATKVLTVSSLPGAATFTVTDGVSEQLYTVNFTKKAKDGVLLIGTKVTGNTAHGTVYGYGAGTADVNVSSKSGDYTYKLNGGKYVGVTLADGLNFQAGDIVKIRVTDKQGATGFTLYTTKTADSVLIMDTRTNTAIENGIHELTLPAYAGSQSLYLLRQNNDYTTNMNPCVDSIAVYRPMNPVLTAITINGRDGEIDALDDKHFTVTIPNDANLASLTVVPTIVRNAAHATTPEAVISNEGAWVLTADGDNTYRIMDKDGDYTDYTITLDRDVLKHTVSFNTHGGSAVASVEVVDGQKLAAAPADPTKEENVFKFWSETEDGEEVDVTTVQINADKEFHAVWEAEPAGIKLINGDVVNHTNFLTGTNETTVEIESVEHKCVDFTTAGSNRTTVASISDLKEFIQYNATTNKAKIKLTLYNTKSSAVSAYLHMLEEGSETPTTEEISIPAGEVLKTDFYEFNSEKNRSFYITCGNRDYVKVLQVKVIDDGTTTLKKAGQVGYSVNTLKSRIFAPQQSAISFEGLTINANAVCKPLSTTALKIKNNYNISFHADAAMTLAVTTEGNQTYYVSATADGTTNETSFTGRKEFEITAGDWYIHAGNSELKVAKLEFIAPKCEKPTVADMDDVDLCEGAAFTALAVSASVSDEGTLHYAWFKEAGETDEAVGTDQATYTPAADGQYYVIVTNHKDNFTDNSKTSNTITVEHFAAAVITTAPVDVMKEAGQSATLSVVASGKNCTYEWFACDDALGTNPVAFIPAETGTSLTVTVAGEKYYKVEVSSDCGAPVSAVAKVKEWTAYPQADVTGSITWDWTNAAWPAEGTASFKVLDGELDLLANQNSIVPVVDGVNGFRADMLLGSGQYVWRSGGADKKCFQGTELKFHTTVAGTVTLWYRSTSSGKDVKVYINGNDAGHHSTGNYTKSSTIVVPANSDVRITKEGETYVRINKIVFNANPDYTRPVSNNIGTLCVDHNVLAGGALGATFYQIASRNELYNDKIDFEEVLPNEELKAGEPYIFKSTTGKIELFYGATVADAPVAVRGMHGWFSNTEESTMLDITEENKSDILYIAQNKLWNCEDLVTSDLEVVNNRAYIVMSEVPTYADYQAAQTSNPAPRRRVTLGKDAEQVVTGVENLNASEQPVKLLINGQIFILRGEKMYDATGRLVK